MNNTSRCELSESEVVLYDILKDMILEDDMISKKDEILSKYKTQSN